MAGLVKIMHAIRIGLVLALALPPLLAQEPAPLPPLPQTNLASAAPPEVVASAVAAVKKLGEDVVLGHFHVAIERMNPTWKERMAKKLGGMEVLERQLAGVARQMTQQGISMISCKPQGTPRSYEVWPGKKVEMVDGVARETMIHTKWLVLVPTVTRFRILQEGSNRPTVMESLSYQAAIADKGSDDWTFIDGSGLTVNDLRSLFLTLPKDMELPPVEKREIR